MQHSISLYPSLLFSSGQQQTNLPESR